MIGFPAVLVHNEEPEGGMSEIEGISTTGSRERGDGTVPLSVAPDGTVHRIPSEAEASSSFRAIVQAASEHRASGRSVVVVQGLGFVGAAVAVAIATASDDRGELLHFVIGVDLPSPPSYWKVEKINAGLTPIASTDTELARLTHAAVHDAGNLRATTCESAYSLADVIVVDIHLDAGVNPDAPPFDIRVDLEPFRSAIRVVGRHMRPEALVLIETTVPLGMCENVVLPTLRDERLARGIEEPLLLAHAYERVMPGPGYINSIRAYPRAFAGVDERSSEAARHFLSTFVRPTDGAALQQLDGTLSSELAKLLENSYRAMNIAFIHEWTLLAEEHGVNLFAVIDAIRLRRGTHDNMRYPGFGVGGYCLPKDSLLAQWGATHLLGSDAVLGMTLDALRTNSLMPLHTAKLVHDALAGDLDGAVVAICGVSYLPDVADTRNSPTEVLVDNLVSAGATVRVHDPTLQGWLERPNVPFFAQLHDALHEVEGVVLAVPHIAYQELSAATLAQHVGRTGFLVDAQNVVADGTAVDLHAAGWRVLGVGKGHWRKLGLDRHE
jgi:UDP-N-acetyl-D-glucosamine dehydrogenase